MQTLSEADSARRRQDGQVAVEAGRARGAPRRWGQCWQMQPFTCLASGFLCCLSGMVNPILHPARVIMSPHLLQLLDEAALLFTRAPFWLLVVGHSLTAVQLTSPAQNAFWLVSWLVGFLAAFGGGTATALLMQVIVGPRMELEYVPPLCLCRCLTVCPRRRHSPFAHCRARPTPRSPSSPRIAWASPSR